MDKMQLVDRRLDLERAQAESILNPDYFSDMFDNVRCECLSLFTASYAAPWRLNFPGQHKVCGYFIQEGTAMLEAAGARHGLDTGDLAIVLQSLPHTLYSRDERISTSVGHCMQRLDWVRAAPLLKLLPPVLVLRGKSGTISPVLQTLANLILELRSTPDSGRLAVLRRVSEAALIRAAQDYLQTRPAFGSSTLHPDFHRIAPVLRALHREPGGAWPLAALARETGMSRSVFVAIFAEVMGEAPGHYVTKVRMAMARELIASGAVRTAEVAARAGYGTEIAFSRAFKRQFGTSPGNFRKTYTPGRVAAETNG